VKTKANEQIAWRRQVVDKNKDYAMYLHCTLQATNNSCLHWTSFVAKQRSQRI